tara:strand:- start:1420 stop:1575 length:156 start_codon:yes stop_codon:yes gene_type:complete
MDSAWKERAKKKYKDRMVGYRCAKCDRKNRHLQTLGSVGLAIQDFVAENND